MLQTVVPQLVRGHWTTGDAGGCSFCTRVATPRGVVMGILISKVVTESVVQYDRLESVRLPGRGCAGLGLGAVEGGGVRHEAS